MRREEIPGKKERLDLRFQDDEQKQRLEKAAKLSGTTLSDFVRSSADERAMQILREDSIISFSERDKAVFIDALLSPPPPNDALKKAAVAHKRFLESESLKKEKE